ncbi:putative membrane protein [Chitinophaga terrae (ex Kim and Jung 2007)]|uniref:Putative membrane protein n=1 Tax=Chitinophaga terrae (ex Kim and Jung 2007) TaxID=408074 RepID=A0A1H4FWP5_9BACT|nr:bestrophin family ion channel [Chitinophaga terrae (ex Kim and Jung 2007)]GEP92777.1 membrane protein [Chitinophaga terrae (ex Kim and Jung 2007)]SEB01551.1 putative membrane protein [Chitinophaga terrae (ex Kim and Jung 2007)]
MINYNPKDWFTFIFRFHKADTVRKLFPMFIALSLYSAAIAWLELSVWKLSSNSEVKNISIMHGLLGFVISLLLVFRTNTAYDRWWEGRRQWGTLVNSSRNLAMKLQAMLPATNKEARDYFRAMIPNYAFALKNHLRKMYKPEELVQAPGMTIDPEKHVPNQLALQMMAKTMELHRNNQLTGEQLIILNNELQSFTEISGACERIRNTPIPFSYSVFIKKFIFFYIMSMPFGYVFSLGYLIIPMVVFIFFVLASLELIAEEIEDPFGFDANDLPTDTLSSNIRLHVAELL